jgi:hypothetical protein
MVHVLCQCDFRGGLKDGQSEVVGGVPCGAAVWVLCALVDIVRPFSTGSMVFTARGIWIEQSES